MSPVRRPSAAAPLLVCAVLSAGSVVAARLVAAPVPGTSYAVLVIAIVAGSLVWRTQQLVGPGWGSWRRTTTLLSAAICLYPGVWGLAVVTSAAAPESIWSWSTAVLALTGHVPLVAMFALLPLQAVRYVGRGASRAAAGVVVGSAVSALVGFALFFDDFAPLRAEAALSWAPGETVGAALHSLFLVACALLGPAVPLLAVRRADGPAARRLALVAGAALGGTALVLLCGAVSAGSRWGGVVVLVAMDLALVALALGCARALSVDTPPPSSEPTALRLTPRESEVLGLLAEGLSNAGIAARLVLSERTVDAHLRSVFVKLDLPEGPLVNRRVHAVNAWAARRTGEPAPG